MAERIVTSRTVAVFGLGYVGAVTAACLAKVGHSVIGIDSDQHKVDSLNAKKAPFYEPGLEEIIQDAVTRGKLAATIDIHEALDNADVALVCVGTPSERNGNLGLNQLRRVCEGIAAASAGRTKPLVIAIRSTVFPGTCDEIVIPILDNARISVVSNPEFLREGAAINDFMCPSLLVVGGHDRDAANLVAGLYASLDVEPCIVSLRTAEMIKYACNAFHAVKISFANEIGAISDSLGVNGNEVMETLCRDEKLNTSAAYLKPGFAFGGSCLPKDLRAINYRAVRLDVKVPLLASSLTSNEEHLNRAIRAVLELGPVKIAIVGLAFKEDTDDLRESPVVALVEHLIGKGRELRIFDPHISLESIYGSNRNFLLNAIPHVGRLLVPEVENVLDWADHVVVTQKPARELMNTICSRAKPVLDLVGMPGVH
jgi:GDP-mannose 6-dehydrogenase